MTIKIVDYTGNEHPDLVKKKDTILALFKQLSVTERIAWNKIITPLCYNVPMADNDLEESWENITNITVLYYGKTCIGCATWDISPDIEQFKWFNLINLVVDKACRGNGYGTMLIEHIKQLAIEKGVDVIDMNVNVNNESAERLYKKLGFKEATKFLTLTLSK